METVKNAESARLADQLERSFHGGAWHGPAVREALEGVDAETAGRRTAGGANSIIETTRHLTFWLNAAHLRIAGGRDVDHAEDWPEEKAVTSESWARAQAELDTAYTNLHALVLNLDDSRLDDAVPGSDPTVRGLLLGTLQHNAYHTGQIVQTVKELK